MGIGGDLNKTIRRDQTIILLDVSAAKVQLPIDSTFDPNRKVLSDYIKHCGCKENLNYPLTICKGFVS